MGLENRNQGQSFYFRSYSSTGLRCQNSDQPKGWLQAKAIYHGDDRLDWFESPGKTKDYWAKATVALMYPHHLRPEGEQYSIFADSYKEAASLCDGQPFEDQPVAAFCSGFFLVSEDLIITAGHCVPNEFDCQRTRFVFDYAKTSPEQSQFSVPQSSVYKCDELIDSQRSPKDFAVIRLNRPVQDRTPLNVRRQGQLTRGHQVMLIGHPMGLPSKIADGGFVQYVTAGSIIASLDAFKANSGSVVLNSLTGLAEGIMVRGSPDYVYQNHCKVEAKCGTECRGESITPISAVLHHIPETQYENPVCED